MTTRHLIIQSNEILSNEYDYVDYLLDIYYKSFPTSLIDIPVSEQELGDMAFYDALGASITEYAIDCNNVPLGKLVI